MIKAVKGRIQMLYYLSSFNSRDKITLNPMGAMDNEFFSALSQAKKEGLEILAYNSWVTKG